MIFVFIGLSFAAALACLFTPPFVPGIVSMTASIAAIITYAFFRRRERVPESHIVRVDGVTVDRRRDAEERTDPAAAFELENEKKRTAALHAELEAANLKMSRLESSADGVKDLIRNFSSTVGATDPAPALKTALANLESAERIASGLRERLAGQSELLSAECDALKRRFGGEAIIERSGETGEGKVLLAMASTLEELCERSNVIAVNAAIEAARIGREGKGFSVIAGEMQNFAGQAKNLAEEFRAFKLYRTEGRKNDEDRAARLKEREETIRQAAENAAGIHLNLAEDLNRLIAAGVSGELEELSRLVENELESRRKIFIKLSRLLGSSE